MKAIKMMMLAAVLTTVWGCSSDGDDTPEAPKAYTFIAAEKPQWSINLTGSDDVPTWSDPDQSKYPNSMFMTVKLDEALKPYSSSADKMTAFIADECRAAQSAPNSDAAGNVYFVLKIRSNDAEINAPITLSYYCATLHRIFTLSNVMIFKTQAEVGVKEDFEPSLLQGCSDFPVQKPLLVSLPAECPFTMAEGDLVGVFSGDDCRGVGTVGKPFTVFRKTEDEVLTVRYYSVQKAGIYTLKQTIGQETSVTLEF